MSAQENIRNFAIIDHIDHGKSTFADRLIQKCGGLTEREMTTQVLDSMDLEKERGITIKAQTVRLNYKSKKDGKNYVLNIIDTPGHVDFSYEVNRSLASCEGSLLIVDSTQGVEAQTLANVYQAMDNHHEIITVLNKIDLPASDVERVKKQIEDVIGIDTSDALTASGKTGEGVDEILEAIVERLPSPKGNKDLPLKALLVDSWYDSYLGVVILVRILDGAIKKGMEILLMSTNTRHPVERVGVFTPKAENKEYLGPGEIGFIVTGIKDLSDTKIGDTITDYSNPIKDPLPGFKPSKPVVFCGLFPVDSTEYNLNLITTTPGVVYKITKPDGTVMDLQNPANMPEPNFIKSINEPWINATIILPEEYLGSIMKLCEEKRGKQKSLSYSGNRAVLSYELPLNEVVFDFYDKIKSISSGYASFDYELSDYREGDLIKLSILVNEEMVDALSMIIHKDFAVRQGRLMCERLKDLIPRHQFQIPIQAAIGGKVIARETISGYRKDVISRIHGGGARDRKKKLLEKQKKGKARMRQFGSVDIPQEAFIEVLKINKNE